METVAEQRLHGASFMDLQTEWRFRAGDDPGWSSPDLDDSGWRALDITALWLKAGVVPREYGWYRLGMVVPESLRQTRLFPDDPLWIVLGPARARKIELFLNGMPLELGQHPRAELPVARIRADDPALRWGCRNVLAIRLQTETEGARHYIGGVLLKPLFSEGLRGLRLGFPRLDDYIGVRSARELPERLEEAHDLEVSLRLESRAPRALDLEVAARLEADGRAGFGQADRMTLEPGAGADWRVLFRGIAPARYRARYTVRSSGHEVSFSELVGYPPVEWSSSPRAVLGHTWLPAGPAAPHVKLAQPPVLVPIQPRGQRVEGLLGRWLDSTLPGKILRLDRGSLSRAFHTEPAEPVSRNALEGEFLGKYLHAAVLSWLHTGDSETGELIDRCVELLLRAQRPDGYWGIEQDRKSYWTGWHLWSLKYLLIALVSYYAATGEPKALEAADRAAVLACGDLIGRPSAGGSNWDIPRTVWDWNPVNGSILEPIVLLFGYTGRPLYGQFISYLLEQYDRQKQFRLLTDLLETGRLVKNGFSHHAYATLSCLLGVIRLHQLTGESRYLEAAVAAQRDITSRRRSLTGSTSISEHFQHDHYFPGETEHRPNEGCATAHWLHLNDYLLHQTGEVRYAEEAERTIYNHLLAATHPRSAAVCYFLGYAGIKPYRDAINCCNASVTRAIATIPGLLAAAGIDRTGLALFILNPGTVTQGLVIAGEEVPVTLRIEGDYLSRGNVRITVESSRRLRFPIKVRVPQWASRFVAKVGDAEVNGEPGSLLRLDRSWLRETIEVAVACKPCLVDGGPTYPGRCAIVRGPQALALDAAVNGIDQEDLDRVQIEAGAAIELKASESHEMPDGWVGEQIYVTEAVRLADGRPAKLVPFADAGQTGAPFQTWIQSRR